LEKRNNKKVQLKTWEEMEEEYISYIDSIVVGSAYFDKALEAKLPKDRIIEIYYNGYYKKWVWGINGKEYPISGGMVKEEVKDIKCTKETKETNTTNMTTNELSELLTLLYDKTNLLSGEDLDKALKLIINLKKTNETLFDKVLELENRLEDVKTVFGLEFSY